MELNPHIDLNKTNASISSTPEKDVLNSSISDLSAAFHHEEDDEENNQDPFNYLMSSLRSVVDGVELKKHNTSFSPTPEKDELMVSISDLSAAFHHEDDGEDSNRKDHLNYLMSSLRSFVDGEDFPEDLLDDGPCDSDDEIDFNKSVKDLLSSVNDLLHSNKTFTLQEGTSLETEMMRLKRFSRRTRQKDKWQPNVNPLRLDDRVMKGISNPDELQKQKEKLANVLKDALGEKEEGHPRSQVERWDSEYPTLIKGCDSAPRPPIKRSSSPLKKPWLTGAAGLDYPSNDSCPQAMLQATWEPNAAPQKPSRIPVKRCASAPRSTLKPPRSLKGPRLTGAACLDDLSDESWPQAMMVAGTSWEPDAAPKMPIRMESVCHLVN